MSTDLDQAFATTIDEGERRLSRSTTMLLATGAVGGIDVGMPRAHRQGEQEARAGGE